MKMGNLSGDQQFCIGYLLAMDDYNHTATSLKYLKAAEKKIKDSFTVSIIRALIQAMEQSGDLWSDVVLPVLQNQNLKMDMRQDAVDIIIDYMSGYSYSTEIITNGNNLVIANGESSTIALYGAYYDLINEPYTLKKGSSNAAAALYADQYYLCHLKLTGVVNGESSVTVSDANGKSVKINFDVISEAAAAKLKASTAMYAGSTKAYAGMKITALTKDTAPYLKNGEPFVPVEFVCSTIGAVATADHGIQYKNKKIILTPGSTEVTIDGTAAILNTAVETKMGIDFISLQDIAVLTDKGYVYDNGLILLFDQTVSYDKIEEDYIINELSDLLDKGKPIADYPVAFSQNGLYGYKDSTGKVVIRPKYSWVGAFVDGIAAVCMQINSEEKKFGFIDVNGNYILNLEYDWAYSLCNGLAPIQKGDSFYYINSTGATALTVNYQGAGSFSSGLASVYNEVDDKWGYIDVTGKLVIPCKFTDCKVFDEGYAAVKVNDKWGYIDRTGNFVLKPAYDDAYSLDDGLATIVLDGDEDTINLKGDYVMFYENGDIYVGGVDADGFLDGEGTYTYADGSQYTGEYAKGYEEGKGIYTSPFGFTLDGNFKEGLYVIETQ
jgi:hypothetical protein